MHLTVLIPRVGFERDDSGQTFDRQFRPQTQVVSIFYLATPPVFLAHALCPLLLRTIVAAVSQSDFHSAPLIREQTFPPALLIKTSLHV
jgi:hypothetical protein